MKEIILEGLNIFFWVYLVGIIVMTMVHFTDEDKERRLNSIKYGRVRKFSIGTIYLVLFILSIKYKFFI